MGRVKSTSDIIINDYRKVPKRNLSLMINEHYPSSKRNRKGYTPELAQNKAEYLCYKLNSPQSMAFYLKCAWNLTDSYIDKLLSIALKKQAPAKYFAVAAAREMAA